MWKKTTYPNVGPRIAQRRKDLKLTLRELQTLSGISYEYISRMENLKLNSTTKRTIEPLARALQCRWEWLATGDGPITEDQILAQAVAVNELNQILTEASKLPQDKQEKLKMLIRGFLAAAALYTLVLPGFISGNYVRNQEVKLFRGLPQCLIMNIIVNFINSIMDFVTYFIEQRYNDNKKIQRY